MARERKVYPREMVAHLWANASQDEARDPSGNMYFVGPMLFSYGSHFVIGYRYETADGGAFFIMNADSYSNTTSKMQWIAQRAIARSALTYRAGGLKRETFYRQNWRGQFMRDMLSQAGALFESAANVSRVSAKRGGMIGEAFDRIRTAQAIADAVLAAKDSRADDRKAARETLRTIADVPTWDRLADNATQKTVATVAAARLVRDEMRVSMADYASRAHGYAADVTDTDASARTIAYRMQQAKQAVMCCDKARDLARRYRFRCPALPDAAALVVMLEPEETAATLATLRREARRELEHAESVYRNRNPRIYDAWTHHAERAANIVRDHSRQARMMDAPEMVPAWMVERAEYLRARGRRTESIGNATRAMDSAASKIASGDSYATAAHARDAVREYANAERSLSGLVLPAGHPLAQRLDGFTSERVRIAQYLADADAHIRQQNADAIAAWRAGGRELPWTLRDLGPMLRLSQDRARIETSWGAQVPVSVAPILWRAVNAARDGMAQEMTDKLRGQTLGQFTLDTVKPDGGIVVGCHDIAFCELEYIAAALGYIDTTAAA